MMLVVLMLCTAFLCLNRVCCFQHDTVDLALRRNKVTDMAKVGHRCQCKAGYEMVSACTKTTPVVCRSCVPGKTYQPQGNIGAKCQRCTVCGRRMVTLTACTKTQDTVCVCEDPNSYFVRLKGYCIPCTKCLPGTAVRKECTFESDRTCSMCKKGTFSDKANSRCRDCTNCVSVSNCNTTHDAVCKIEKSTPSFWASYKYIVIGVLIVFLNLTLVAFAICLCIRFAKGRTRKRGNPELIEMVNLEPQNRSVNGDEESEFMEIPAARRSPCEELYGEYSGSLSNDPCSSVPTSSDRVEVQDYRQRFLDDQGKPIKAEDIPTKILNDMAAKLTPKSKKDWRLLASRISYSIDDINCLGREPMLAAERVLLEFMSQADATAYRLYCILKDMGREDVAELISTHI